jgi:hypothetical protein
MLSLIFLCHISPSPACSKAGAVLSRISNSSSRILSAGAQPFVLLCLHLRSDEAIRVGLILALRIRLNEHQR